MGKLFADRLLRVWALLVAVTLLSALIGGAGGAASGAGGAGGSGLVRLTAIG